MMKPQTWQFVAMSLLISGNVMTEASQFCILIWRSDIFFVVSSQLHLIMRAEENSSFRTKQLKNMNTRRGIGNTSFLVKQHE